MEYTGKTINYDLVQEREEAFKRLEQKERRMKILRKKTEALKRTPQYKIKKLLEGLKIRYNSAIDNLKI